LVFFNSSTRDQTSYFNIANYTRQRFDLSQNGLQKKDKNAQAGYAVSIRLNFQPVRSDQSFFG
jgi:hypothetical protein